jgi:hypothetical protein
MPDTPGGPQPETPWPSWTRAQPPRRSHPHHRHRTDHRPRPGRLAHLGDPIVHFRGQFCYVALPGPRSRWLRRQAPPSPILRLRYQGHIDSWKIAIFKYSTETYTEAELPTTFGPAPAPPNKASTTPSPSTPAPAASPTDSPLKLRNSSSHAPD